MWGWYFVVWPDLTMVKTMNIPNQNQRLSKLNTSDLSLVFFLFSTYISISTTWDLRFCIGNVTSVASCWIIRNIHDTVIDEGPLEVWEIWPCKNFQKYLNDSCVRKVFTCGRGTPWATCHPSLYLGWGKLLA